MAMCLMFAGEGWFSTHTILANSKFGRLVVFTEPACLGGAYVGSVSHVHTRYVQQGQAPSGLPLLCRL